VSKRKLLLADDSITIQKVVNLTFADEGIEVITVGDGDSAMEKLREILPDLVLADVNMPGLTGYQICEQIKQEASLRQIPVILLVGSFEPFDEEESKRVGADAFLTKPFQSIRQLVTQVTDLLNSTERKMMELTAEPAVDSFADTLEMPLPADESESPKFSDDEFDDEMIQTSQVGGFTLDEAQKFETRPVIKYDAEDYGKTQPLSRDEIKDFAFIDPNEVNEDTAIKDVLATENADEYAHYTEELVSEADVAAESSEATDINSAKTISDFDGTENYLEEIENNRQQAKTEELPYPVSDSILDLDEDFLELPPAEGEDLSEVEEAVVEETVAEPVEEPATASHSLVSEITAAPESAVENSTAALESVAEELTAPESVAEESTATVISTDSPQISDELIDLIVQKVIEKLSDKAIKDVAWEVVPQMSELIIKQIAEEKLKD
jgi:CheY-like chemotaxis protein